MLKDDNLLRVSSYIDGQWVDADSGDRFAVDNPADGTIVAKVADCGGDETRRAIEAAERALPDWRARSPQVRSAILKRWHALILEHRDDLAMLMTLEQGKTLAEARGEVAYGASFVEWFAEEGRRVYGDVLPTPKSDRRLLVLRQAVGVTAAITPWNFPNAMLTRKAAPALAVGCTMVLKPAAETPLSALALAELAHRAGVPAGVLNVVPGLDPAPIGEALTSSPIVRKLTFTGSTAVGKLLLRQCADTVKRASMELGGNAPVIVFDDADLDRAVRGAVASKYRNSGQVCISANRVLVHKAIHDAFVARFIEAVGGFRLGDGRDAATTHGPMVSERAVSKVDDLVRRTVAEGATAVVGGERSELGPCFYGPTVLTDVQPNMGLFREEIFGPVAPVLTFSDEAEAIRLANDTRYGLAAYVYTNHMGRAMRVGEALEYGMVGINETGISSEVIPFGGVKESGIGREGSKYGLDEYLETKYLCLGGLDAG
ncbi:MAG: NAD-dependent succinate-semialdehyde dehydrogenase [Pseudomonadota bacterium]